MLRLSSEPGPGNLLRLAVHLLETDDSRLQDAFDLAMMAGVETSSLETYLTVCELFVRYVRVDLANDLVPLVNVEKAYTENPFLKDVFTRIGLIMANSNNWQDALPYLLNDQTMERLKPEGHLKLAEGLGHCGGFQSAEAMVEMVYQQNDVVKDGYARLGWIKTKAKNGKGALSYLQKDRKLGRLAQEGHCQLAEMYWRNNDIPIATAVIEDFYASNTALNLYSRFAWNIFINQVMDYEKALPYLQKDYEYGRMDSVWLLNFAKALAITGRKAEAQKLILDGYQVYPDLRNGLASCGHNCHFAMSFNPEKALLWYNLGSGRVVKTTPESA